MNGEEYVTVENYVEGKFQKYINNTGKILKVSDKELGLKAESFAHYMYEKSGKQLIVLDIQGAGYVRS